MRYRLWAILLALLVVGCDCEDEFESFPIGQGGATVAPTLATGTAADDTYTATINTALNVNAAGGVFSNDTANGNVTTAQNPSAQGGIVAVAADGSFTYTPAAGFAGLDTFTYTVQYPGNQSQATVTVRVFPAALFVDNTAPAGGSGSREAPFNTLAGALAAANQGDTIFVFSGDGTNRGLVGPFTLARNQRLIGEGVGFNALAPGLGAPGQFPVLTGPITMRNATVVRGFRIENSPGDAIIAGQSGNFPSAGAGGTVTDNRFSSSGGAALVAPIATGTWNISNNDVVSQPSFLNLLNVQLAGEVTYLVNDNTLTDVQKPVSLMGDGITMIRGQFTNNTATGATDPNSFEFSVPASLGGVTLCLDFVGNTTNTGYSFTQNDPSTLSVEQFAQFTTLNTGTLNPPVGTITDVADGFCGF